MLKRFARKRKTLAALATVLSVATVFQAGTCTVNIDQELLQRLMGALMGPPPLGGYVDGLHVGPGPQRSCYTGCPDDADGWDAPDGPSGDPADGA